MSGAAGVSWLAVTAAAGPAVNPEVLLAMLGPLVSACLTWVVVVRAHRQAPERVLRVLITGFAAKMVFFAAYLVLMLRVADLSPRLFVTGFTSYIIGLYGMEAWFLARLPAIASRTTEDAGAD